MKVMRSVVIDAPIAEVWAAVRRFDGVANWNPGVTAAVMESGLPTEVGAIRKLDIADGSVFRETLLAHSDLDHFYTYDIIESPLPCRNYVSCHRFIEITDGKRTLGIWQGEFDCAEADAEQLESVVGDMIYLAAQQSLNQHLQEKK
jgi:ligand-binding SRPBCC domain-containing protein